MLDINIGNIVEMKKTHPCGNNKWQIMRVGSDIKIKCLGCDRIVMLTRGEFDKKAKKLIKI